MLLLTIAVIVITLVVQGASLGPLVRRSGVAVSAGDTHGEARAATAAMTKAALAYLDQCRMAGAVGEVEANHLTSILRLRLDDATTEDKHTLPAQRRLRRDLIAVESAELTRLYEVGDVGPATRRELQRRLDLEHASLQD